MKKSLTVTFWILTDLLLVLSIVLFPSFFSIFAIIAAAIFAPIEEWQDLIKKYINKPIKSAIIAICVAFVIALFPFPKLLIGVNNFIKETEPSQNGSKIFNEETSAPPSDFFVVNSNDDTDLYDNSDEFYTPEGSDESYNTENSEDFDIFDNSSGFNNTNNSFNTDSYSTSNTTSKNTYTSSKINSTTTSKNIYSSSKQQPSASSSSKKPTSSVESNKNNVKVVYRTPSGKRYHYSETCGGSNSYKVSLNEALESKLTPCKKCAE